jgi:hypothetical protein
MGHVVNLRLLFLALFILKKWEILGSHFTKRGGYRGYIPYTVLSTTSVGSCGELGENI